MSGDNGSSPSIRAWLDGLDTVEFIQRVDRDVGADLSIWPFHIIQDFARLQLLAETRHNGEKPRAVTNGCLQLGGAWWCVRRVYFNPQAATIDVPATEQRPALPSNAETAAGRSGGGGAEPPGAAALDPDPLVIAEAVLPRVRAQIREASRQLGQLAEAL